MLHLKNRYTDYKSLFSISSFNHLYINRILFNIRNNIKYIFYYLLKKTIYIKLFYSYKLFTNLNKITTLQNVMTHLKTTYIGMCIQYVKQMYYLFYYRQTSPLCLKKQSLISSTTIFTLRYSTNNVIIRRLNNLLITYKNYIFIIYIWLYSLKFLKYYKLTYSNSKTLRSRYTVLRSPHKDKKSREQFKINKIKKHIMLPTFICKNVHVIFGSLVNETVLVKRFINKNVV